jgi:hypothetical protein
MTAVQYGKSKKYYETHCGLCGKKMRDTEPRVKGHAVFNNDVEQDIIAHELCVKAANIQVAVKQTKELGMQR